MKKNFYPDEFEQLLKESADNFRMYPSKRVWHSIYNDLHPSRKWPSLAVCILLISAIIYVGLTNKSQVNTPAAKVEKQNSLATLEANQANTKTQLSNNGNSIAVINTNSALSRPTSINTTDFNNTSASDTDDKNLIPALNADNQNGDQDLSSQAKRRLVNSANKNLVKINSPDATADDDNMSNLSSSVETHSTIITAPVSNSTAINETNDESSLIESAKKKLTETDSELSKKTDIANKEKTEKKKDLLIINKNPDKEWIEDFAFHNKPFVSKWKSKVTYQFYFTPSVGYRILSKESDYVATTPPSLIAAQVSNTQDYKEALVQYAAVNMEVGGGILYSVSKNWKLKAGVQLNYTNYAINAYELKHPTATTLTLNDMNSGLPTLEPRATRLANAPGLSSVKLNNSTYQVSIPLGADIKLAGRNNLKWYAGATIQPTFISSGNSYLISSDLKNYVEDNSLMRKWNLNAGVETFISYKTKGGIIINAGPQFRYQLLSTYSKQYSYDEKLYNVGLKIGIVTKF